jgi:ABC-2 type transport system permease protein
MSTPERPWNALWYLYSSSWRNRIRVQMRRLREPRYLLGGLAVVGYISMMIFSPSTRSSIAADPSLLDIRHLLSILFIGFALGSWWLAAPSDSALAFSAPEVFFLFPAPVKRRTLVQARLLSVQAVLLLQVLIWTLLLRRSAGDLNATFRALGLWVLFTTVTLHRLGATLARTHVPDVPKRAPIAQTIAVMYIVALSTAVARTLPHAWATWNTGAGLPGLNVPSEALGMLVTARAAIQTVLNDPIVHTIMLPIHAVTAPAFAFSITAWLQAMPLALLVLALHYLWIVRDPQPFEELAVGSSARFAERIARVKRGENGVTSRHTPFRLRLGAGGNPAVALMWKNVTAAMRTFRPRALVIVILLVVLIAAIASSAGSGGGERGAVRTAITTTFFSAFFGALLTAPAWFRLDLRHDLTHLPFLKTAPLAAHTIIATEILTAATIITVAMAVLFGIPAFFLLKAIGGPFSTLQLLLAIVGAALALAGVNLLHVTLYNAVALWFPAWVPRPQGGAATGGASVVGQVYITLIGILATLAVLLVPPVAAGWGVFLVCQAAHIAVGLCAALALLSGLGVLVFEWLALARLLGSSLDRLEPSDIPSAEN